MNETTDRLEESLVNHYFDHEQMDVYRVAKEVALWVNRARFHKGCSDLRDHAVRASRSVVLNIAEGRARGSNAGRNHYRIALACPSYCTPLRRCALGLC